MNLQRLRRCCLAACLLALSIPATTRAEHGERGEDKPQQCDDTVTSTSISPRDEDGPDEHDQSVRDNGGRHGEDDGDEGDDDNDAHCVITPPVDVAEAPKALMLSASAAVSGGAAILIVRRRSRNATPLRA
jgi:hypothetical protein